MSESVSFYDKPQVRLDEIPVGPGIPFGIKSVVNPRLASAGVYGAWGESCPNEKLAEFVEHAVGEPLTPAERMDLAAVGFNSRHHLVDLSPEDHLELEVEVGARFLKGAANACGWEPGEVQAVLAGVSGPVSDDYVELICRRAGIPGQALKVSIHKACDGAFGGLHLCLNPQLGFKGSINRNLAEELRGKKVLVGGIEGLSRFINSTKDKLALQIFGNGAGVIGLVPGVTMEFLVGKTHEVFDEAGALAVRMFYPHNGKRTNGDSNVDIQQVHQNHIRVAGFMHEPEDGAPIAMAGPMGMVKLFVRNGVQVVKEVYQDYRKLMDDQGHPEQQIKVVVVHHANLKINSLKQKQLLDDGIPLELPWLFSEFGNVSAASGVIAYLHQLPTLNAGDHIMFDGFGAGSYYDVFVVILNPNGASL
jgi:3-oxoacyl-[acyl-carrier-protein] synthase III